MSRSCPQSSIIGPVAWNFCMDVLLKKLEETFIEEEAEAVAYADDLAIIIKGNSKSKLETIGTKVMEILNEWCTTYKLKVSKNKTTAILLKGNLNKERMPRVKIEDKNISFSSEVKYLGIVIDEKLNFVSHAKHLKEKLVNFIMSIRRVVKEEWGLKNHIMKVLYNAVAILIATYGAVL